MIEGVLRHACPSNSNTSIAIGNAKLRLPSAACSASTCCRVSKTFIPNGFTRPANSAVYCHLAPDLTRGIDWDLITQHYDPVVHDATALRLGTA
jgi:hypothetical protein